LILTGALVQSQDHFVPCAVDPKRHEHVFASELDPIQHEGAESGVVKVTMYQLLHALGAGLNESLAYDRLLNAERRTAFPNCRAVAAHRQSTHDAIPDLPLHGVFLSKQLVAAQFHLPTLATNPWPVNR
jgi:hypothetical protein